MWPRVCARDMLTQVSLPAVDNMPPGLINDGWYKGCVGKEVMPHGFKLPLQRGTDGASIVAMDLAQSMYCRRALCMRSCQQRCSWQVVSLRACERRCRHVSFCVHASHVAGACCLCVCQRWSCEAYHQHRRAGIGTGICIDCMHTCICERPSTKLVRISVSAPALSAGVHTCVSGRCLYTCLT
jgi:hypothetical protein